MIENEKIRQLFVNYSLKHQESLFNGDSKLANKIHKKLHKLYDEAKLSDQISIFSEFLENENENVRLWSAIFTINYNPEISKKALSKLSKSETIVGLSAKTTIELWKKGLLTLL